jgi:hypothetical protein
MSKTLKQTPPPPTEVVKVLNPEVLQSNAIALTGDTFDSLVTSTKNKKAFGLMLKNPKAVHALSAAITTFVAVDANFEEGAAKLGKILHGILNQNQDTQILIIRQICATSNTAPLLDKDNNEVVGKKGLQHALFAAHPNMMKRSGKDTLAGKKFSYYLRLGKGKSNRYGSRPEITAGGAASAAGEPSTAPAAAERTVTEASKLWRLLYEKATDDGKEFLMRLTAAAGVKFDDWLPADTEVSTGN